MAKCFTALKGENLRNFIKKDKRAKKCVVFPETGLDLNEQAAYIKNNPDHTWIITLSPMILSDADDIIIIDDDETKQVIKFGDSINRVSKLWRTTTIGDKALDKIKEIVALSLSTDERINKLYVHLGDSVERIYAINRLMNS